MRLSALAEHNEVAWVEFQLAGGFNPRESAIVSDWSSTGYLVTEISSQLRAITGFEVGDIIVSIDGSPPSDELFRLKQSAWQVVFETSHLGKRYIRVLHWR